MGNPSSDSPVFVTANYKLSFDALRKELTGIDAWMLVADTRGINVWCAAGKKTFSSDEIALQVQRARLEEIVSHRELILPQFAATGVASQNLNKLCGFKGIYGPLRAEDIPQFLKNGREADEKMRSVTFSLAERLVLVPVEISLIWKPFLIVLLFLFFLSGISPDIFSTHAALSRGMYATWGTVLAILSGAMITPLLLPWIPVRQFWLKGALTGGVTGLLLLLFTNVSTGIVEHLGLWFWIMAASSYMAMNFTGATPYTSLSGVEKEMRKGLPIQIIGTVTGLILWIAAPFIS